MNSATNNQKISGLQLYDGFEVVVGLEVHIQLDTKSKLFSNVSGNYFGDAPNSHCDNFTLGLPGTLPVLNKQAVEHALMFGLALGCDVTGFTQFHRKNYFYPDAPRNYQISQYDRPIARDGAVQLNNKRIGITRAHLEDDAGKNLHPDGANFSLLDLNRAGCPLIEMVTEPDIRTPEEARAFLYKIQAIVRALGISDASPEEGKMRCDVNVSLRKPGDAFGTKVEVKNLNSFASVARSLEFEIKRQSRMIREGKKITQDTLGWDEAGQKTFLMRTKEGEADYRYFPDPDLPPLEINPAWVEAVRAKMPKLPDARKSEYMALGLKETDAETISLNKNLASFFEAAQTLYKGEPQKLANWLGADVMGWLNENNLEIQDTKLSPLHLTGLLTLIDDGTISGRIAKELLPEIMQGQNPLQLVESRGLRQVTDTSAISAAVEAVMAENAAVVANIASNPKAINALFGQVMKRTSGQAKPELVRQFLEKALENAK